MNDVALQVLLERLLWPIPRTRLEVARSLAQLINGGDEQAKKSLLCWIRSRKLESECVLGLGIIDAFNLGDHFRYSDVKDAVNAPSHLSDWILKRNFSGTGDLFPFRYEISDSQSVVLPSDQNEWFDRYRKWAVPPIFSRVLRDLEEVTKMPLVERWKHEWSHLQATYPRPKAEYPHYFSGGARDRTGQFDHGQRELYVSAFLRTLAFATLRGPMPHEVAERIAMLGLTMNRGWVDVEPIARPNWSRNLVCTDPCNSQAVARELWECAKEYARSGETLLAVRIADIDKEGFVEFELTMTVGPEGYTAGPAEAGELEIVLARERPGEMAGLIGEEMRRQALPTTVPVPMVQCVQPTAVGRAHIELACSVRLASPLVFGRAATIGCETSEICLQLGRSTFSRWVYWYADWEPTTYTDLGPAISSVTVVANTELKKICDHGWLETGRLGKVKRSVTGEKTLAREVQSETFWM